MSLFQYHWIDSCQQLAEKLAVFSGNKLDYCCLDTEFVRTTTYWPKAGLIQIHCSTSTLLIDPLSISDWSPLATLLADERITKVIHASSEDLQLLYRLIDSPICNLFDSQIAYALLSDEDSIGYGSLVSELLDVKLDHQKQQRSDWLRRPLSAEQCKYAVSDVVYLEPVYLSLRESLDLAPERNNWLKYLCQDLLAQAQRHIHSDGSLAYTKVKGLNRVRSKLALKRLYILTLWREQEARKRDVVRSHLIADDNLIELALNPPVTDRQWQNVRFGRKFTPIYDLIAVQKHLDKAAQLADDLVKIPTLLPKSLSLLYKLLIEEKKRIASQLGISHQLLANKREIQKFALSPSEFQFSDWRDQVLLNSLRRVYTSTLEEKSSHVAG